MGPVKDQERLFCNEEQKIRTRVPLPPLFLQERPQKSSPLPSLFPLLPLTAELNLRWQMLQDMKSFFFRGEGTPNVWLMTAFWTGSICEGGGRAQELWGQHSKAGEGGSPCQMPQTKDSGGGQRAARRENVPVPVEFKKKQQPLPWLTVPASLGRTGGRGMARVTSMVLRNQRLLVPASLPPR